MPGKCLPIAHRMTIGERASKFYFISDMNISSTKKIIL